jgi:hypothetical protein
MKMIKTTCFILICMLCLSSVNGQKKRTFKVNPGQLVDTTLPQDAIYTYPEFTIGSVQFKNGNLGAAKMNYNCMIMEMEFINDKGDTVTLDDVQSFHYISISTDTFYYDKGFLRQISNKQHVKLAEKKVLMITNRQKLGGMGEINGGSVETKDQLSSSGSPLKGIVAQEILTYSEYITWYFGDRYNHFKQATKKNVIDIFGRNKPGLEKYLNDNHVDYFSEEDMKKLAAYLRE